MTQESLLKTGDKAHYQVQFGPASVAVRAGSLVGSGRYRLNGADICVRGDEASATVSGCTYTAGPYTVPGTGTLSIYQLNTDQLSTKTKSGGKAVLIKGTQFQARFTVTNPAKTPPDKSIPDPTPFYSGTGYFETSNTEVRDHA